MQKKADNSFKKQIIASIVVLLTLVFSIVAITYSWYTSNERVDTTPTTITATPIIGDTLGIQRPGEEVTNRIIEDVSGLVMASPGKLEKQMVVINGVEYAREYFNNWYVRSPLGFVESDLYSAQGATSNSQLTSAEILPNSTSELYSFNSEATQLLVYFDYFLELYTDQEKDEIFHDVYCVPTITAKDASNAFDVALQNSICYAIEMITVIEGNEYTTEEAVPWLLFNSKFTQYTPKEGETPAELKVVDTQMERFIAHPRSQVRVYLWIDACSEFAEQAQKGEVELVLEFNFTGTSSNS